MNEIARGNQFIVSKLTGDAALEALVSDRVFDSVSPSGVWPAVVFQAIAAPDVRVVGGTRIFTDIVYRVRGIVTGNAWTTLAAIADRIDEALHKATGTDGGFYVECVRERGWYLPEEDSGVLYRHLGGEYLVKIHPA